MTILGQDWPDKPIVLLDEGVIYVEPELTVEDLRYEQLIATIAAMREALLSMPPPVVNVSEPDLSAVVMAVQDLRPGASAEDIGEAIVARLGGQNDPAPSDVLAKLVKALEKLDFRLKGIGTGSGGGGSSYAGSLDVSDRAQRQVGIVTVSNSTIGSDVSDRAGRLVGHVTVDTAPLPLGYLKAAAGILMGATSGFVTALATGANIAALVNPAASGKNLVLYAVYKGALQNGTMARTRGATISGGALVTATNRGGAATGTVGRFYSGSTAITATGGVIDKQNVVGVNADNRTLEDGSVILRPGDSLLWNYVPTTTSTATIEVVWWDE